MSRRDRGDGRKGFTLLELLLFVVLFALVAAGFSSIFTAVLRTQSRQVSATEVEGQSQFLLQQFQYYIANSSLVDIPQDTATSTLRLRMSASSTDPAVFTVSGGVVYLQLGSGAPQALTNSKVTVSSITFTKRSNPPAHDAVNVSFTMAYNTQSIPNVFTQSLQTTVSRVSAATFDSNLVPSSTAVYNLGVTGQVWSSVNNVLYFSGSNVGIGVASPHATFQVANGNVYVDTVGKGLMLRSADGVCWLVTVSTQGAFSSASTTCP